MRGAVAAAILATGDEDDEADASHVAHPPSPATGDTTHGPVARRAECTHTPDDDDTTHWTGGAASARRPAAGAGGAAPVASARATAATPMGTAATRDTPPPPSHHTANDSTHAGARRRGCTSAAAAGARRGSAADSSSEDDPSSDSDSSSDSSSSNDSRYSTECTGCDVHIARSDPGRGCDVFGCRATRCTKCMPEPTPYLCRQHGDILGSPPATAAGAAAAPPVVVPSDGVGPARLAPAAPPPSAPATLILALPEVLRDAARCGVESALTAVAGWKDDPDMRNLVDDLVETLHFAPASTKAKGSSAISRLREFLEVTPPSLLRALATADALDVTLAAFVSMRLRVATRRQPTLPPSWTERPIPDPVAVKGEVSAILGLLRLASLLPADPKGTVPRTRRVMRKCGCLARHGASPRGYTFLWELIAAWNTAIPRNDPRALAVATLATTAIHFLLRPIYVRSVSPSQIRPEPPDRWILRWGEADKTRPARAGPAPAAAAAGAGSSTSAPAPAPTPAPTTSNTAHPALRSLPPKHPRISAAQGELLSELQRRWRSIRMAVPEPEVGPLFCRTEVARQTAKVPKGAHLVRWRPEAGSDPVPVLIWPRSRLSERIIKRELVRFLSPIVGPRRAARRMLSGFRGGGEMEHVELGTPVSVRATVGWWVARRVSAEGALVTYEGSSVESMAAWSARLGTLHIRVLAPGVFRVLPCVARSIRARAARRAAVAAARTPVV